MCPSSVCVDLQLVYAVIAYEETLDEGHAGTT